MSKTKAAQADTYTHTYTHTETHGATDGDTADTSNAVTANDAADTGATMRSDRTCERPAAPALVFRGEYAADRSLYSSSLRDLTASTAASVETLAANIRAADYPDDEVLEASTLFVSRSSSLYKRDGALIEETVAGVLGLHPDLHVLSQLHLDIPTSLLAVLEEDPDADLSALPSDVGAHDDVRCTKPDLVVVDHRGSKPDDDGLPRVVVHVLECRRGGGKSDGFYVRKTTAKLRAAAHLLPAMLGEALQVNVEEVRVGVLDVYGRSQFPANLVLRPANLDRMFRLPVTAQIERSMQLLRGVRTDLQREALVEGARADATFRAMLLDAAGAVARLDVDAARTSNGADRGGGGQHNGGDEGTVRYVPAVEAAGTGWALDAAAAFPELPAGDIEMKSADNVVPLARDHVLGPAAPGMATAAPHDAVEGLLGAIDRFAVGASADPDAVVDRLRVLVERQTAVAALRGTLTCMR